LVNHGSVPSNAQLCQSSIDGHQHRMLGIFPCAIMVERTTQATVETNTLVDCVDHSGSNVNFSIGDGTSVMKKLSRYQKLNLRHREQKQRQKVNSGTTIHGGDPSHPLPVDVVSATEATNDIDAVQQPEQLDSVETPWMVLLQNQEQRARIFVKIVDTKMQELKKSQCSREIR